MIDIMEPCRCNSEMRRTLLDTLIMAGCQNVELEVKIVVDLPSESIFASMGKQEKEVLALSRMKLNSQKNRFKMLQEYYLITEGIKNKKSPLLYYPRSGLYSIDKKIEKLLTNTRTVTYARSLAKLKKKMISIERGMN